LLWEGHRLSVYSLLVFFFTEYLWCRSPPACNAFISTHSSCYLSCIPNADSPLSLLSRCSVDLPGDRSAGAPLVPGGRQPGARFPCSPSLRLLCLDPKPNRPPLEYAARPLTALLGSARPVPRPRRAQRLDLRRPSAGRSSPNVVAPSPWCCHNGNETNCKSPTRLLVIYGRVIQTSDSNCVD